MPVMMRLRLRLKICELCIGLAFLCLSFVEDEMGQEALYEHC